MNEEPLKSTQPSTDKQSEAAESLDEMSLTPEVPANLSAGDKIAPSIIGSGASPEETAPATESQPVELTESMSAPEAVSASVPLSTTTPEPAMSSSDLPVDAPKPEVPSSVPAKPEAPLMLPASTHAKRNSLKTILLIVVILVLMAGAAFAAYRYGHNHGYDSGKDAAMTSTEAASLKVPANATMIAQCVAGEGTQYVAPSNIPQGPIYNVWKNKVTGIEYMLGQSNIAGNKTINLALMSQKYNHIDVMYEAAGHAGFTEPHYHVILSLISYADEQKITCGSSSSSMTDDSAM